MSTYGPAYDEALDGARVADQLTRIRSLMLDGRWRTLAEICAVTRDPASSVSAQLRHLRKDRFGGFEVSKRRREPAEVGVWEYRVQKGPQELGTTPPPARPSKVSLRSALREMRRLHRLATAQGQPPHEDFAALGRWVRHLSKEEP